jgi:hypothetical protein
MAPAAEGSGSGSNPTVRAAETRSSHFPTRTRAAQICGKGGIETERERLLLEVVLEIAIEVAMSSRRADFEGVAF